MLKNAAEVAVGLLFPAGAAFNATYTTHHSTDFYRQFADGAWLTPSEWLLRRLVIPNATLVTISVIAFPVAVATAILSRGVLVAPALFLGGSFAVLVAFFSNPAGTVGNLALAAVQFLLAVRH